MATWIKMVNDGDDDDCVAAAVWVYLTQNYKFKLPQ